MQLLRYFDEESEPCGDCDTCMTPPVTWDATVAVQKLLSAVIRLDRERGQRFGSGQVIDVLRGNDNDRSRASDHESLSVWGVGDDLSESSVEDRHPSGARPRTAGVPRRLRGPRRR